MRSRAAPTLRTFGAAGALIVAGPALAQQGGGPSAQLAPGAQTSPREISTKTIAVGEDEALLTLGLAEGPSVELGLRDGRVVLDDETIGSYSQGDALDVAWRGLLADAIAMDGAPLGRALIGWEPPSSIDGDLETSANALDRRLEELLVVAGRETLATGQEAAARDELAELLRRSERLAALSEALAGIALDEVSVHVGEDVVVDEEVQLDATLVVLDGEVEVLGVVRGDVVVVGGDLRTGPDARIEGDVRLVDGRLLASEGEIEGEVVELGDPSVERRALRDELRDELRSEIRRELRSSARADDESGFVHVILSPFRWLWRAVGQLVSAALSVLLVGGLGSLVLFFGRDRLEVVAETARRAPMRAGTVGLAGTFLFLPLWVVGILVLVASLIGILALPIWIVFFPVAATLAALVGYYAVVLEVGRWIADHRLPFLAWVRRSNAYTLMFGGSLGLLAAFIAADMLDLFGSLFGILEGLLVFTGVTMTVAAALVGLGAVLITRGGRHPEYFGAGGLGDPFEPSDWSWSSSAESPGGYPRDAETPGSTHGAPTSTAESADAADGTSEAQGRDVDDGGGGDGRGDAEAGGSGDVDDADDGPTDGTASEDDPADDAPPHRGW